MKTENIPELNSQQTQLEALKQQELTLQKEQRIGALLIGVSVAPVIWSLVTHGLGFKLLLLALLPAFFIKNSLPVNEKLKQVRAQIKAHSIAVQ